MPTTGVHIIIKQFLQIARGMGESPGPVSMALATLPNGKFESQHLSDCPCAPRLGRSATESVFKSCWLLENSHAQRDQREEREGRKAEAF